MRTARILQEGAACYHCMSRVVDRRYIFGDEEMEYFRKLMRSLERFSGVEILTYALMSNHFHLLLHVPERQQLSKEEFADRIHARYAQQEAKQILREIAGWEEQGRTDLALELRAKYEARMYNLPAFMQDLKQSFSRWYNKRKQRRGTLWEERYKSVLVESGVAKPGDHPLSGALMVMAAYIDLNPVRAGLCADPKDYRFCGYGEALGGSQLACAGIARLFEGLAAHDWDRVQSEYRMQLYAWGEERGLDEAGHALKRGLSREAVAQVLEEGGRLSPAQTLRCRVRYFSDGAVLGSRGFVDGFFKRHRGHFGPKRKDGARELRHGWTALCTIRDLRGPVVLPSA